MTSQDTSSPPSTPPPAQPVARQPRALYVLFTTEMWERFSFYGLQSLLKLYMLKVLLFDQARSSSIIGSYTGLVYFTPFFGGLIADRLIGYRRAIYIGGVLMMLGHAAMAVNRLPIFFLALGLVILGNGLFKANISTVVGKLYGPGDERRDRGFTLFYMGINLGAFLSPIVCNFLAETFGWHWGFSAATVGMAIGLCSFGFGQRTLRGIDLGRPAPASPTQARQRLTRVERQRLLVLMLLLPFVLLFWAAFAQSWDTLTVWAELGTDRRILGHLVPAGSFQALQPLFLIALAAPVSYLWFRLARAGKEPSTLAKMALGLFLIGLCFLFMVAAAAAAPGAHDRASALFLVGCYLLMAIAELALSPIGLSLVTKLAPPRFGAMLMGLWFLSLAGGFKLGGVMGEYWDALSHVHFFEICAFVPMGAAALFLLFLRPLGRMMHGAS